MTSNQTWVVKYKLPGDQVRTPREIIVRLNQEIVRILRDYPDMRLAMENAGGTIVGSSPEQFGAYHQKEMVKWRKVIKAAGLALG